MVQSAAGKPPGELPLVSIVIPSFNQGEFLEEAILSVLGQTYPYVELLVMDGGSQDRSIEIMRKYASSTACWVSEPDQGQTDAINKGFRRASGEFVWWLNSDDALLPDSIALCVEYMQQNPGVDLVYGDLVWIDEGGVFLQDYRYFPFDFQKNIIDWVDISQAGALARHAALKAIGYLDADLHYLMDRDAWIRLALQGSRIHHLATPLAKFRVYPDSKTQAGSPQAAVERYQTTRTALQHPVFAGRDAAQKRAWANTYAASARVYMKCGQYRDALREVWKALTTVPAVVLRPDSLTALVWSLPGLLLGFKRITSLRAVLRRLRYRGHNKEKPQSVVQGSGVAE